MRSAVHLLTKGFSKPRLNELAQGFIVEPALHFQLHHTLQFRDVLEIELHQHKVENVVAVRQFRVRNRPYLAESGSKEVIVDYVTLTRSVQVLQGPRELGDQLETLMQTSFKPCFNLRSAISLAFSSP